MEKYESKQQQIRRPAEMVFTALSSFDNFTPVVAGKVDDWHADGDSCSFKVKGFAVRLRMAEREPFKTIKIVGEEGSPLDFTFWMQLKELATDDTRMRLVLHADMNMMVKMMIGKKLQGALDQIAESIAAGFNGRF